VGSGVFPVPLSKEEIDNIFSRMNANTVKHNSGLVLDDAVIITDGPFKDLEGKVSEIDNDRGKVKVLVLMFGRETSVELDMLQIRRI
jgi:transcriptional antiterminator NusG